MVSKDEALTLDEWHLNGCTRTVGPRGGVTIRTVTWRRNGVTKTWKRDPSRFAVPIKYGFGHGAANYGYLTNDNADQFHAPDLCPSLVEQADVNAVREIYNRPAFANETAELPPMDVVKLLREASR